MPCVAPRKPAREIQRSAWSFCALGHHKMLWWTGPPVPSRAQDVPNDVREITALSFDPVNGGRSAKAQVRGCSRRFANRRPSRTAPKESSTHMRRRRPSTIRASRAAAVPPVLRGAPYEGSPVDGKRNNGVNYRWFSCGLPGGNRNGNSVQHGISGQRIEKILVSQQIRVHTRCDRARDRQLDAIEVVAPSVR